MLKRRFLQLLATGLALGCDAMGSQQGYEPQQPIAFSHAQHAGQNQIACQYCHYGAERSRHAGVPSASLCMNCHSLVKKESPEIQKLARALATTTPIEWVRVHRLPDFAYFSHASHVTQGLACQTCHGPVETMVRVSQTGTFSMGYCLGCHRETAIASEGKVNPPTDCADCHR